MLSKFTRENISFVTTHNTNTNPEQIEFSKLECCCLQIRIIDKLRPSFTFISQLYLDHNSLKSLNGIEQFQNLEILSLNFNFIGSFRELKKIQNNFFLKELSLVGNPVDSDPNCNFQDLKKHLFKNLESYNAVSGMQGSLNHKIFTTPSEIYQNKAMANKVWQIKTQTDQDLTERVRGSFVTDKLNTSFKTKKSQNLSKVLEFNEPMSPPLKSRQNVVKSTTLNQYSNKSAHFHPLKYHYSDELQRQGGQIRIRNHEQFMDISLNEGVFIKPFVEEYQIRDMEEIQREMSVDDSRRRRRQADQEEESQSEWDQREEDNNFYKQMAYKMLEQQKQAIADAFYVRSLKQRIFQILKNTQSPNKTQQLNQKKKALSAIKLFSALQHLF